MVRVYPNVVLDMDISFTSHQDIICQIELSIGGKNTFMLHRFQLSIIHVPAVVQTTGHLAIVQLFFEATDTYFRGK